jgi:hypothetical protein
MRRFAAAFALLLWLSPTTHSCAQALEEVVVTGSYRGQKDIPGAYLKRRGDFLLLSIAVNNDTREETARKNEIYETLQNAINAAARQTGVELSLIDNQENVIALTRENSRVELRNGTRPDTSTTTIRVKKKIPESSPDADRLIVDMTKFVGQITVAGRTTLEPASSVDISIVEPDQYRAQVVQRFHEDVARVMGSLGPDYRLLIDGIDRPVKFSRVGLLEVALYIPYGYRIVPTSVTALHGR